MLRKLLLILFTIYITCTNAQVPYQKCTVYSTKPGNSKDSFVSKMLIYNKYGRVIEERTYRKPQDEMAGNADSFREVILFTYTKDTLLSQEKAICFGDEDQCIDDTVVTSYSYNKNNKIDNIIFASYGRGGTGCFVGIGGTRWYDSTKTDYRYDEKGNLIQEANADLAPNMPTGFTIGFSPNFKAYDYDDKNRIISIRHLHVKTLEYSGQELIDEYGYQDTTELAKEIFTYYDHCYTVHLVATNTHKTYSNISYVFYDQSNNIIQEYLDDEYLNRGYNGYAIERFYSYQPDKRLVKEIRYDYLGRVEQVDSYIYE